jgi:ubiquinone/menaquinone biosynthesis C-methylase UbiE
VLGSERQVARGARLFDEAIALKPDLAEAYASRGPVLGKLKRYESALESHAKSTEFLPTSAEYQENFCRCAAIAPLERERISVEALGSAVLVCLSSRSVDYQDLGSVGSILLDKRFGSFKIQLARCGFDFSSIHEADPGQLRAFCSDELLLCFLKKIIVADSSDERFFTGMREGLLRYVTMERRNRSLSSVMEPLAIALAEQCFLNEYVWSITGAEYRLLEGLTSRISAGIESGMVSGFDIGVLGCYEPLARTSRISAWCQNNVETAAADLKRLIEVQVLEPLTERDIARGLKRMGSIDNETSLAVRAQYEKNPYPRWLSLYGGRTESYTEQIAREIAPSFPELKPGAESPRILVAGCGTGRHAISYALGYRNSRVIATDLSSASLAYAVRTAHELGVSNIEFVQGDLLNLTPGEHVFDMISCAGVLHHLAEPERGLQSLLRVLAPDGYLMLALYSALARADIARARSLIEANGFEPTVEGIRACREFLRQQPGDQFRSLTIKAIDFYSTSMVRDLLFHVEEHCFTIPQIKSMLERNSLEFLGFHTCDPAIKNLYRQAYPDDASMVNLDNWAEIEEANPKLFRAMYQFWTRRKEAA